MVFVMKRIDHRQPSSNAKLPAPSSRREFLKQLAAASAAAMMVGEPRLLPAAEGGPVKHPAPTADACIVLWMAGGMAAPETFDPKRYHPFEVGLPIEKVMSTFPAGSPR